MPDRGYPSGIYGPGNGPPDELTLDRDAAAGNDPSWLSGPYLEMSERWQPMLVCMGGTQAFREHAGQLLPIEPKEDEAAWRRRVSHAVLSPFTMRIGDQAAGLICRKPIQLEPKDEGGEVDEYWTEWIKDVDGYGTDLDAFARRVVLNSILLGHSAVLVDFPSTEPAENLLQERQLGLRPYFLEVRADQILGWRKQGDSPLAPVDQVRINEYVTEPVGLFGDRVIQQIRCLFPGGYQLWRKGEDGWVLYQEGTTSLSVIPLAVTYSNKVSELMSTPPLLPLANLNILHGQRQADLQHALHVAALPVMYLKGYEDTDNEIALSANSAILLPETGDVGYAEPASSAFDSQQAFITELENQMRNLGISTLFSQTYVGETAEAKAMDRSDSDSMLSVVAQDLEAALQNAMEMAASFVGLEAPKVCVSRDFDLQKLDGPQAQQYLGLWQNGAITLQTFLEILSRGEILPDIDIESEIELLEQEKLANIEMQQMAGLPGPEGEDEEDADAESADSSGEQDEEERARRVSEDSDDEEDEEDE